MPRTQSMNRLVHCCMFCRSQASPVTAPAAAAAQAASALRWAVAGCGCVGPPCLSWGTSWASSCLPGSCCQPVRHAGSSWHQVAWKGRRWACQARRLQQSRRCVLTWRPCGECSHLQLLQLLRLLCSSRFSSDCTSALNGSASRTWFSPLPQRTLNNRATAARKAGSTKEGARAMHASLGRNGLFVAELGPALPCVLLAAAQGS
jgi:hypothetical protein